MEEHPQAAVNDERDRVKAAFLNLHGLDGAVPVGLRVVAMGRLLRRISHAIWDVRVVHLVYAVAGSGHLPITRSTVSEQRSVDDALAEIRRLVEVGFERTNGQNALILQRLNHTDDRHAELAKRVDADRAAAEARDDALEKRADAIERDAVTRAQLADRTRQIIAVVGLMLTAAGVAIALILGLTRH